MLESLQISILGSLIDWTPGICREADEVIFVDLWRAADNGVGPYLLSVLSGHGESDELVQTVTLLQKCGGSLCSIVWGKDAKVFRDKWISKVFWIYYKLNW